MTLHFFALLEHLHERRNFGFQDVRYKRLEKVIDATQRIALALSDDFVGCRLGGGPRSRGRALDHDVAVTCLQLNPFALPQTRRFGDFHRDPNREVFSPSADSDF